MEGLIVYSSSTSRKEREVFRTVLDDDVGDAQMILASKVDDGRWGSPDVCQLGGICLSIKLEIHHLPTHTCPSLATTTNT